jgi:hypothetical protein
MLVFRKRRLDDGVALAGPAQTFAPDKIIEPFLDTEVHEEFLAARIPGAKRKRRNPRESRRRPAQ